MIVRPTSPSEIAQIVRDAAWSGERISISGGGTRAALGNTCESTEIAISLASMHQVIDYTPDDMVIAVEAGCTLEQIDAELAQHDQWLPVAAAHADRTTIGGMFASGIGTPVRQLRGALKDLVIGVEAVLADGSITKSGGMTVKNVSGYDLSKLYAGSLGAFGIVTRLNLKVFPRPQACQELSVRSSDTDTLFRFVGLLLAKAGEGGEYFLRWDDGEWNLHFRQFGAAPVVPSITEQLAERASELQLEASIRESQVETASAFTEAIDSSGSKAIVRIGMEFDQQSSTASKLIDAGCEVVFVDPAGGLVYGVGAPDIALRDTIRSRFDRATFISLPNDLKDGIDVFGALSAPVEAVTRRLKDEFDPDRRLNPGRYLLGL